MKKENMQEQREHEETNQAYGTEKFIHKVIDFSKTLGRVLTNPGMLLSVLRFQKLDHIYESLLRNERLIKLLALVVAIVFAINIRYVPNAKERYSADINNYPLSQYYDQDRMVVDGLPATVDVTLIGDRGKVDIARAKSNFEVYADLRNLPPGTHKVNLEYSKLSNDLDVKLDPSTIVVTIMSLIETDKPIRADFVNLDQIDEMYVLGDPQVAVDTVKIKGPQIVVDQIASVKAIVDVSDLSKLSDYEAPVYAYDRLGNKLDVEIRPERVMVSTQVTTPSKVIPIKEVITGNPPEGYSIESISIEPSKVKLYGESDVIDVYTELIAQVDLYQLDENNEIIVKLEKPENVHKMDTDTVKVKVKFEETKKKILEDVPIEFKNLDSRYKVKAKSLDDAMVDLTLSGAKTRLDLLSNEDIKVFIDLNGYTPGEYQIPVTIETVDNVIIDPSRAKINIIITE